MGYETESNKRTNKTKNKDELTDTDNSVVVTRGLGDSKGKGDPVHGDRKRFGFACWAHDAM